jgi:hypothetical protein
VESNHHSARRQGYSLLSSPLLGVRKSRGWPAGLEPAPAGLTTPGASVYTTATTKAGTTGLEPAASRLTSECSARLSYAPENLDSAGGIRTHGLELMRLARTASPLPRKSGWQESNLRSPAPEAGGVAKLPYSQMNVDQYPRRDSNPQLPG